jgi:probable HAF family extracellular repeat protein
MKFFNCLTFLSLIFLFGSSYAFQYQLHDIGKLISDRQSYATCINDNGQVAGIITSNRMWFVWGNNGVQKLSIYQQSSTMGIACSPYLNNFGIVSEEFINSNGQYLLVEDNKIFLCGLNGKTLVDNDSAWIKPENGFYLRVNNNSEIAGTIKADNGKNQAKYIDTKLGIKKILQIKASCTVTGVNDLGDVIGWFQAEGLTHSFLWRPSMDDWQIIENFRAASINNHRIIVGTFQKSSGIPPKGALWENGSICILDDILNLSKDMTTDIDTIEIL